MSPDSCSTVESVGSLDQTGKFVQYSLNLLQNTSLFWSYFTSNSLPCDFPPEKRVQAAFLHAISAAFKAQKVDLGLCSFISGKREKEKLYLLFEAADFHTPHYWPLNIVACFWNILEFDSCDLEHMSSCIPRVFASCCSSGSNKMSTIYWVNVMVHGVVRRLWPILLTPSPVVKPWKHTHCACHSHHMVVWTVPLSPSSWLQKHVLPIK